MPRFNSPFDGAQLFYRDYVPATYPPAFSPVAGYENKTLPTLVFIHGWPMSSSMFEHLMVQLCESYRFRCIASDRRGFGNSDWNGSEPVSSPIDYSVFAADTVHLLEKVKPGPFIFVAASMGPGETIEAYFQSQFVRDNCKGFFFIGAALAYPISTPENPSAPSREVWDAILQGLRGSRADYTHYALPAVLGQEAGTEVSEPVGRYFEGIVALADSLAIERCVQIITTTDFSEKLRKLGEETNLPIVCVHGDKDSGCPVEASAAVVKKIIPRTVLKIYQNGSHGIYLTHAKEVIADLLELVEKLEL